MYRFNAVSLGMFLTLKMQLIEKYRENLIGSSYRLLEFAIDDWVLFVYRQLEKSYFISRVV